MRSAFLRALCLFLGSLLSLATLAGCSAASEAQIPNELGIEPIPGLPKSFLFGMDVSSALAEENSGVVYRDRSGQERDLFLILREAGLDTVRLRVWLDPYDARGRGYGGGNCDLETAIRLGRRATDAGLRVCLDFHYSDFWADPKRQHAPKAWADMSFTEKEDALYDYTRESLEAVLAAGVDVSIVQVGNETNNGIAGEHFLPNVLRLYRSGCRAVRDLAAERGRELSVALHLTDPNDLAGLDAQLSQFQKAELDYDILALSYYPYWHGGFDGLRAALRLARDRYGKQVLLAETAYCHTEADGDGYPNSVSSSEPAPGYPATVEGQAAYLRDLCALLSEEGALGMIYWEGAWIPVGPPDADNSALWERYGSGWASSYAADYDPEDAGLWYGGCSWDNQALFSWGGEALPSLYVFRFLRP